MSTIKLSDIIKIDNLDDYKLHVARKGVHPKRSEPLDDYVIDNNSWKGWNEWETREDADVFGKPYIFSLMSFYHEPDMWLFGGVFRVVSKGNAPKPGPGYYDLEYVPEYSKWEMRLKIHLQLEAQYPRRDLKLATKYDQMEVVELFRYKYPKTSLSYQLFNIPT